MMDRFQQEAPSGNHIIEVFGYPGWRNPSGEILRDYLTIPVVSAEPERVFSGAKITLSDSRCRIGDDALESLDPWSTYRAVREMG